MLADVPFWKLPGLSQYKRDGTYATWLQALIPKFGKIEGLEIHWVVFSKHVPKDLVHCEYNQTFYVLERWKFLASMLTGFFVETRQIRKIYNEIKPDIIHAWGSEDAYGVVAARLKSKATKVYTMQGCLSKLAEMGGSTIFKILAAYEKPSIRKYYYATAESKMSESCLLGINNNLKTTVIDYGVDDIFHSQGWQPDENPVMVFIGTIGELKGVKDIIRAFADPRLRGVRLKVIGKGALEEELKKKSSSNVEWLGKLDTRRVAEELSKSWGLVIPTYFDTGPSVIKEARVVGLPVITTNMAGASTYVKHGKSGFIIEPGNVDDLIRTIADLTSSLERCHSLGVFDWEQTRDDLRVNGAVKKFANLYRKIL